MKSILILAIFLAAITITLAQTRASFGEPCNKTTRCDSKASLTCVNETCLCVKQTEMTYEFLRNKCVVLSGERCSYTAIEVLMDQTQEKRYSEKLDCVQNAQCSSDGYCECDSTSFENVEGLCETKRGNKENCTKNEECNDNIKLTCINGQCSCNAKDSTYDTRYGQCVGKAGAPCAKYSRCVQNAQCNSYNRYNCECNSGFTKSTEGFCLGYYGASCDEITSPCDDNWSCINKKCTCHFPSHQVYETVMCRSHLGGPCLETIGGKVFNFFCRGNAECRNDTGVHECVCRKGYIKSINGNCLKAFGTTCTMDDQCDQFPGAKLICKKGICSCGDFQEYDEQSTKCVGLYGAKCNYEDTCIKGAFCDSNANSRNAGTCRCPEGTVVDSNRKCVTATATSLTPQTQADMEIVPDENDI